MRKIFLSMMVLFCLLPFLSVSAQGTPEYKFLTVYTALPESELHTYFSEFEKDTGIKIQYVRLSAGELLARIRAEKGPSGKRLVRRLVRQLRPGGQRWASGSLSIARACEHPQSLPGRDGLREPLLRRRNRLRVQHRLVQEKRTALPNLVG